MRSALPLTLPQKFFCLAAFVAVLCSCATHKSGDAATALQGRREYELIKYRNPATGRIPDNIRQLEHEFGLTLDHTTKSIEQLQADLWERRGPWNLGGRTRALALDATNERIIVAAGVSGGVWRSEDAGATWIKTTKSEQLHSVTSIVQDTRAGHTNDWYMGTGEAYGNSAQISGNGIWKSTDGGRNWDVLPTTVSPALQANNDFAYNWRVAVHPTPSRTVLFIASVYRGILRSVDGGTTWTRVLASNSFFSDIVIASDGTVYASLSSFDGSTNGVASQSGIFMSKDEGATWKNISPADLAKPFNRIVLGLVPQDPKQFFAIAMTPGSGAKSLFQLRDGTREEWHSLWKRSDTTWTNLTANIPLFGGRNGDLFTQGGYDMLVRVSPIDSNLVLVGGTNLYRSTDGFTSTNHSAWIGGYGQPSPTERFPSTPNHHSDQHDLLFLPSNPNVILSANDGGVMRADTVRADTVRWKELNQGYLTTQFYTIAIIDKANDPQIMGGLQDNGTWATRSLNVRDPWVRRNGGDGAFCAFADTGRTVVASTQSGVVRRVLLDAAGNELGRTRVDPIGAKNYMFINPLTLDKVDDRIMYLPAGAILWRNNNLADIPLGSDDSTGVNWDSLPSTRIPNGQMSAVLSSASTSRTVYYGTTEGHLYKLDAAQTGQPVPVEITASTMPKGAMINCIVEDPTNTDHLLMCFSNYSVVSIFSSTDAGLTWHSVSGNLEESPTGLGNGPAVNSVGILPHDANTNLYVAATSIGMFYTTQLNGQSTIWSRTASDVIGNVPCDMVLTRASDKLVVVGTHGNGVFSGKITSLPPPTTGVTLVSPPTDTRGVLADTTLTWNVSPDAILYTVELAQSQDFQTGYRVFDGLMTTSLKVTDLVQGPKQYFWRVTAYGVGGRSAESETWSFTTAIVPPVLISPKQGDTGVIGNPIVLKWSSVPGAISYDVLVANNITFNTLVASRMNVTDTTVGVTGLENSRRYYWKARSRDIDAAGLYSNRTLFNTGTISDVQADDATTLEQASVTPNPARDAVKVEFMPWTNGLVQMSLVDESGRSRHQFAAVQVDRVRTSVELNCSTIAAGAYTLVIEQGRNRMMLPLRIVR